MSLGLNIPLDPLPPGKGIMHLCDGTGDTRLMWDRNNRDEVENARRTFSDMRSKGFAAYKVTGKEGGKGEVITTFNPDDERVILAPALRGG